MEEIFWKWASTFPRKSILVFEQGILLDIAHLAQINIEWIKMLFLERKKKGWVTVGRLLDGGWQEQNKSKLITGCFPSWANSSTDNERVGKNSLGYGLGSELLNNQKHCYKSYAPWETLLQLNI